MKQLDCLEDLGRWILEQPESLQAGVQLAGQKNPWFIKPFCELALENLARVLVASRESARVGSISENYRPQKISKMVGVVLPGKIPLGGIREVLTVYLMGHIPIVKLAEDDAYLLIPILKKWQELDDEGGPKIQDRLTEVEAIVFPRSDTSDKILRKYFSHIPHLIHRQAPSIAVLDGSENDTELLAFMGDVLTFYGQSESNISHVLIPDGFELSRLLDASENFRYILANTRYRSNLDFHLAKAMLNRTEHLHNDILALVRSKSLTSATSILHYESYHSLVELKAWVKEHSAELHILVTNMTGELDVPTNPLGTTHQWSMTGLTIGKDTFEFLTNI